MRRIQMPEEVKSGTTMAIEILWENIGVSLSYHRFQLAYQIKNGKNTMEHISKANIRSHFRIQN
ncbi:MAG: hypothetical protein JXR73_06675 [Candidatus Omnitrophica bacterium]|nr:hypothetical protein [Candidatus Omnitrophota bacterium]